MWCYHKLLTRQVITETHEKDILYSRLSVAWMLQSREGLTDSFEKDTANRLIHQIGVFNQQLASNVEAITGTIIYLAGFNIQEGVEESVKFPPFKFIPWYLLLSNGQSIKRVYRQPELSKLLQKLSDDNPYMVDIESIISDMEIDSNFDLK